MPIIRPAIEQLPPFQSSPGPGAPASARGLGRVVRLNANEGPVGPFPAAIAAGQREMAFVNRYPDPYSYSLETALAAFHDVPLAQVVVGNGSTSLIRMLGLVTLEPGDEVVMAWPSYPQFRQYGQVMGATVHRVPLRGHDHDLEAMFQCLTARTRLVFICNPNNPTGGIVPAAELDQWLAAVPDHVVTVLDEAYHEYVTDPRYPDSRRYLGLGKRVAILRTFSKLYGLAGLRVGYALAAPELAEALHRVRELGLVNHVGLVAAEASLEDRAEVERRVTANASGRAYLGQGLNRLGLQHAPSQTNFVWTDLGRPASEMAQRLAAEGILVRPGGMYDSPNHIRVTVGLPEENEAFLDAMARVL